MGLKNYGNIFKDFLAGLGLQVQRYLVEASSQVGKLSTINRSEFFIKSTHKLFNEIAVKFSSRHDQTRPKNQCTF